MSKTRFFYFYDHTGEHRRPVVTVCRLRSDEGEYGYGWAICSDADNPCKRTGRAIAEGRARAALSHKTHQKSFLGAPPFREEGKERLLRSSKSLFPCMGCRILGTLSVSAFPAYWYGACKGFLNLADVAACTRWHGEQQCFQRATADALSAVYGSLFLCAVQRSPGPPTIGYEAPGFQMRRLGTYQGCEVTNRLSQMPP